MNCSGNKTSEYTTLILDGKDREVMHHALGHYRIYLQAHVDLLGGNDFITSELTRVDAVLEELGFTEND